MQETVQNNVYRIMIDASLKDDDVFDTCVIETVLGDVFFMMCQNKKRRKNYYEVCIYRTVIMVSDHDSKSDNDDDEALISRAIDTSQVSYKQSFFASQPAIKKSLLCEMLSVIKEDDANTWNLLRRNFGCEDVKLHLPRRTTGIC